MVSFFQLSFFALPKDKTKRLIILFKSVHEVAHIIRRLMANYVYQEGAVTPIQDIIDPAEQSKENTNSGSHLS